MIHIDRIIRPSRKVTVGVARRDRDKQLNIDEYNLFLEAYNCDILKADVLDTVFEMKKQKVQSVHQYIITETKGKESRWQTYVKGVDEKRIKISATSEQKLYEKLYHFYFEVNATTLRSFFPEWIAKRNEQGVSPRTVRRNENHWDKYYANNKIVDIPINKLDTEQIESFFHECIRSYELTVKELGNMKFIMVDMLKLAKKRKLIEANPMLDVDVKLNACRPQKKQNDTSRVYLPDEKERLFKALNQELIRKPDCTDVYGVFLLFKTGLRIGELVALKWCDIDYDNHELHVHRMETQDINSHGTFHPCIKEYTKKKSPYGDRFLPFGEYEIEIFRSIEKVNASNGFAVDDFIFCDADGRTKIREIDNLIRKCCNIANIDVKSAHDIRRTVASEMFNQGIPVEIIRNFLGHSDIKTTFGYILDNHKKSETSKMILNSLNSLNGLKRTQVE